MEKYSGIKRIDEAEALLKKEYEENGLEFLLLTLPKQTQPGMAYGGSPDVWASVCVFMTQYDEKIKRFIEIASDVNKKINE